MGTVKQTISIDNVIPKASTNIGGIVVFFIFNVVFVGRDVLYF